MTITIRRATAEDQPGSVVVAPTFRGRGVATRGRRVNHLAVFERPAAATSDG